MADDKSNTGARDRATVSGNEPYEVRYFANKHGITMQQAEQLIAEHGGKRSVLDAEAEKLTKKS